MNVVLVNPNYQTLTSRLGVGHQVPLGLLMVGGRLLDEGHNVHLVDAESGRLSLAAVVDALLAHGAEVVMSGHAGSTPAHPVCVELFRHIKQCLPGVTTVYGGVYPTYHAESILEAEQSIDYVIRGEGEATAARLVAALESEDSGAARRVPGIAFRNGVTAVVTQGAGLIRDLGAYRVGWELIDDWDRYRCFGLGRAAVVQYSRGCPHHCSYCGQFSFWAKWRRRDPIEFVDEIEWLYRRYDIRFFTIADENPTTSKDEWLALLSALAARRLPVYFFCTIRAADIVRDREALGLYRSAGILYVLMGIESTSAAVLRRIEKESSTAVDIEACRLLRANRIFSIIGHVVGFSDLTRESFSEMRRALAKYGGDYLNAMYATPHSWTAFAREEGGRELVTTSLRLWDYRHQVLAHRHVGRVELFCRVKMLELWFHLRPRRLLRILEAPSWFERRQLIWCLVHTSLVWVGEIVEFVRCRHFMKEDTTTLRSYLMANGRPAGQRGSTRESVQRSVAEVGE